MGTCLLGYFAMACSIVPVSGRGAMTHLPRGDEGILIKNRYGKGHMRGKNCILAT